jgi:deacetoxycephalosporin-C synthase/deacetoxycephalosporin-C hydroxylase
MASEQNYTQENWDFQARALGEMAWYTEADAPAGVPVLDLGALRGEAGESARTEALARLREAVTGSGFFYVKNHGMTDAEVEAISNTTRDFFGRPEAEKLVYDGHETIRGYTGYRFESTARFFGTSRGKDLCMKYTMGPELTEEEVRERITSEEDIASNAYSPNLFPDADFRAAWVRAYERVHGASIQLLEALGEALALEPESRRVWSEMLVEKSCGELRFFQYPDVPREACADVPGNGVDRMAAHFDMDVITLLHQTPCENGFVSLEASIDGQFVKIPAIRGTFVVNLGEVLRLLTGGRVRATIHRVARPPQSLHRGSARDVMVFFQAPPLNARLRPMVFADGVGVDTIFDELYRAAGDAGHVRFAQLRARLFGEFIRQMEAPATEHEFDAHLFTEAGV